MLSTTPEYGNLISEIKNNFRTHLRESITEMFIKLDESLFEMAENADNNKDQSRYFELMRDSRALKDTIAADFINFIDPYLRPFAETKAEKDKIKSESEGELSLVDQDEMEDMVMIKSMGGSVASQFSEPLSHLEARLEHLALQTPDIFYKKALQPTHVFQAFDDALADNFDLANKKTLFKFFNDHVGLQLGKTYDAINNLLINADILPKIKLHANKSTPRTPKQTAPESGQEEQFNAENDMNQGGYAMTAPPGHVYQNQGGSQGSGAQGSAADDATAPAGYQHTTAGMPASQVGEVVGEFLGGAPLMPQTPADSSTDSADGATFFPASTGQYYGHQEILNALSSVQQNPVFSNAENAQYDGEAIKQAVLTEIAKTSGGVVTKSINRIAEKTIDFIELIFDAIIDDDNISDTIKTLLLRLQIPVIKASMMDQEFFIYDDHPARVLLDKIAQVGIGVTDRNDEIYIQLDKIITTLVNEFELQTDSFQTALDHLNAFLEEREAEALKKEEEAQRQVLREHARNTVLKALRTATRGKILPESVHALILKRWPTMMYNHYLKQGKENDEWVTIVDTLRSIINSLQPLKNADDLEHLVTTREHLIETTRAYLRTTNQSEKDIEQVIQDLVDIHQSLIDQADFPEEPEQVETATEITEAIEEEISEDQTDEEKPEKLQLPTSIMPGMWFQVYTGEDKAQRRCKLSVVILEDQKLVFVNYQGEVVVEKNLGDFLEELTSEKSKVIMGHSVFDHALSHVVHGIQHVH
ncbi:MAG: DUF1631 domain-containing protein [Gammaproteobacteria bacterium]|nr:DUF1631 domain-containing protein [Gammaproteobacteria bacterium]